MCLVLAVEGAAMVLVMIGAYRHPASETPLTWQAFILAGLFDLPALGSHAPRLLYVYPAFFVVMGAGVLIAAALGARAVPCRPHAGSQPSRRASRSRRPGRVTTRLGSPGRCCSPPTARTSLPTASTSRAAWPSRSNAA